MQFLKSVGPARARSLARLGIETVGDLLAHYPRRYFDRTAALPIRGLRAGQDVTVLGEVLTCSDRRTRRGGNLLTVSIGDDTGVLFAVWFNQKFLAKQFRPGRKVMASGVVQMHGGRPQLAHHDFEILDHRDQVAMIECQRAETIGIAGKCNQTNHIIGSATTCLATQHELPKHVLDY